ncbi:MAG TPA: hypothetical protein DCS67_04865 [Clostridiales bacterium UBA8960]|nr:hypothetical protein [Clostridiales bacterium UBA8960]
MHSFIKPKLWAAIRNAHGEESQRFEFENGVLTAYAAKINVLSFKLGHLKKRVRIVGLPPSISLPGYHAENASGIREITDWVKTQKGHTLILNADDAFDGIFQKVSTLPSVVLKNTFKDFEAYVATMRSHYRYRLIKAKKRFKDVEIIDAPDFDASLYALYEAVYERSEYPLVKNTQAFFTAFPGYITAFYAKGKPIGFCQYHIDDDVLYFMFCGLCYDALKTYDTYLNLLMLIVERGIEAGVKTINFGQTTETIKMKLGGELTPLNLYYYHDNALVRTIMKPIVPLLGYSTHTYHFHVFKNLGE